MSVERRRQMIEPEHLKLSVVRQCDLVSTGSELRAGRTPDEAYTETGTAKLAA
jgi:hypothetical protein